MAESKKPRKTKPAAEKAEPAKTEPAKAESEPKPERPGVPEGFDLVISSAPWRPAGVQRWLRETMGHLAPSTEANQKLVADYNAEVSSSPRALKLPMGQAWLRRAAIQPHIHDLESDLAKLRKDADGAAKALLTEKASAEEKEKQIHQLEAALRALNEKQALAHLLTRVGEPAHEKLLESESFRAEFAKDTPRNAYVLSIDIRRSTELMLKAREPKLFAEFIMTLAARMRQVIIDSFGVFDKFTGDGILAFFPEFYSGDDAGYFCLDSAAKCHEVFAITYKEHRHCFLSVLADTGLGIGIDYGAVQIVQIGGDVTVVGAPVVYACRMSSCTAGETLVNETAFEKLFADFSTYCDFDETELEIKHEGKTIAHRARLNGKPYAAKRPSWLAAV